MAEPGQSIPSRLLAVAALMGSVLTVPSVRSQSLFADGFEEGDVCAWRTGSVSMSWTVDDGPPATHCPSESVAALTDVSGPLEFSSSADCVMGTLTAECLVPGSYLTTTLLEDALNTWSGGDIAVTVIAGQIANVGTIDFSTADPGWVTFDWTVPGGCPLFSYVDIVASVGPTWFSRSRSCEAETITVPYLVPGPYTVILYLRDGGGLIDSQEVSFDVIGGQNADVSITFLGNLGTATFWWTVPGGCPPLSSVEIVASAGPTTFGANGSCESGSITVPNLVPGPYTVILYLRDSGGGLIDSQEVSFDVIGGQNADVGITFSTG